MILLTLFSVWMGTAYAAPAADLGFRHQYSSAEKPLTTEAVWTLDPEELNPHRQRWVLERKVEMLGLEAREIPKAPEAERYGVHVEALDVMTRSYFRADGPWFRSMAEFPCSKDPVSWFGTREGSQKAADVAAQDWESLTSNGKLKLSLLLDRVRGGTPGLALRKANLLFNEWYRELNERWRIQSRQKAKLAEWRFYTERAKSAGVCKDGVRSESAVSIPWESMMESPGAGEGGRAGGHPSDELHLLARAPSKRWDGLYSIRVNITIGGRKLNGRFLIDSGVGKSIISPDWLTWQGVTTAWVEKLGERPVRVPWAGSMAAATGGLAPVATVDKVEIGNRAVDLHEFALFDTEFFSPPETAGTCCDGVLGTDFLRKYVVELQPGPPTEVKLWPAENFHLAEELQSQWVETGLTPSGEPVSSCVTELSGAPAGKRPMRLAGIRWDTGREYALDIHIPWQKAARAAISSGKNSWEIRCGGSAGAGATTTIAQGVPATFPVMDTYENKAVLSKVPAASAGMALIGVGRLFLDFPHGRIWIPQETASARIRENVSGLQLRYENLRGQKFDQRALRVKGIRPGSPAQDLTKRGLRNGMVITLIDSIKPEDLDTWDIEQRLAGMFGETVTLQWSTPQGLRLGQLKVR